METIDQILIRHERERFEHVSKKDSTLQALQAEFSNSIPELLLSEWDKMYGDLPLKALHAEHDAEKEAHPEDPRSYPFLLETEADKQSIIEDILSEDSYQNYLKEDVAKPFRRI